MKQFAMAALILTTLVMSGCHSQTKTDDGDMDIDTQRRMKGQLEVTGIPHVIILEPGGYVVWEGSPYLNGYELTHSIVENILEIAKEDAL